MNFLMLKQFFIFFKDVKFHAAAVSLEARWVRLRAAEYHCLSTTKFWRFSYAIYAVLSYWPQQ